MRSSQARWEWSANGCHHFFSLRTFHAKSAHGMRRVCQRDVVAYDELIQVLAEPLPCFRLDVEQEAPFQAEEIRIAQNPPLYAKKERVASFGGPKLLHVIGRHRVEESRAVLAGHKNLAAMRQVQIRSALVQRLVIQGHRH